MGFLERVADFLAITPMQPAQTRDVAPFVVAPSLEEQLAKLHAKPRPWRLPSVAEALGVPAIQRAVTLIANTTGSLSTQTFRNGDLLDPAPRVVTRPDPFSTPRDCYRDMGYQMASRGETVLWIASRDPDNTASALIVVPLAELTVEENPRNRLYPIYRWGDIRSTRYSPANTDGQFVHTTYLREPGALRGMGPLQMAGAASSVSVEAQEWAANFYASGGFPSIELHSPNDMTDDESAALKAQWTSVASNMPRVTTGDFEVREHDVNPQGAQMLQAREYNNGDAARLFGIPGMLMEYSAPGSSLTYQNITEVWTSFVKGCLAPNYLEPIEQAMGDLLPRSQVVRFYVDGLLRADVKTRFDVYESGIGSGVLTVERAQQMEGLIPGSPELVPVQPAAPAAVPASIPFPTGTPTRMAAPVRCAGRRIRDGRMVACGKLLAEQGPFVGTCPRCKKAYAPPVEDGSAMLREMVDGIGDLATRDAPAVTVTAPITIAMPEQPATPSDSFVRISDAMVRLADREPAVPVMHVAAPNVIVEPPVVDMTPVAEAIADLRTLLTPRRRTVERDEHGRIVTIHEQPVEETA